MVVGLAPGAHGANRTGRMFTGDRSGEWLYRALFKAGFANQPESTEASDGLTLIDCVVTNICHCAPPQNKPSRSEITNCQAWLAALVDLAPTSVYVALGQVAWSELMRLAMERAWLEAPRPKFSHGCRIGFPGNRLALGCYHPSQQNTFTGRLTEPMIDAVFHDARSWLDRSARE